MFSRSVSTKSEALTPPGQILVELNCHKQVWPLLGCLEGPVSTDHFCALTFGLILILHCGTSRRTALRLCFFLPSVSVSATIFPSRQCAGFVAGTAQGQAWEVISLSPSAALNQFTLSSTQAKG